MSHAAPSIGFISLGCSKALVDSERIITRLRAEGYRIAADYTGCDLVVVNTCGFIEEAIEESLASIAEALAENGRVIVTGCLGARGRLIEERFPEVLAVTGPQAYDEVMGAVHRHLAAPHDPYTSLVPPQGIRLTPRHYAYLKIAEGCNHRCTFCVIPALRGPLASRAIGEVMNEAERLVAAGVKELLVIAQDTAAYGADLGYRTGFWGGRPVRTRFLDLARALGSLGVWVRLHYVYPYPHVDAVLPLMAEGRILPYLDVPFQHASARILRAMKRPADREDMIGRIRSWRAVCPDITLRSTFIVGFPGETEDDFTELLDFLREAQLDRVGCFPYSAVEGAAANALPGQVPEPVKQERVARFMEEQADISATKLQRWVGQRATVLVDEASADGIVARRAADAPEVDGIVRVQARAGITPGDLLEVMITDATDHDLLGRYAAEQCDSDVF